MHSFHKSTFKGIPLQTFVEDAQTKIWGRLYELSWVGLDQILPQPFWCEFSVQCNDDHTSTISIFALKVQLQTEYQPYVPNWDPISQKWGKTLHNTSPGEEGSKGLSCYDQSQDASWFYVKIIFVVKCAYVWICTLLCCNTETFTQSSEL